MTYPEAINYLESFINYEKKDLRGYFTSFKLDRMRSLCGLFGNPQNSVPSVHIAGTKGKGSTAAIIQSILIKSGFKAGLYTSPHLIDFRERMRIGQDIISERDLAGLVNFVSPVIDDIPDESKPSFFEVYTLLAYLYFRDKKADIAVYETGLGGRLDATNVIEPRVSAITSISLDHTDILGTTLTEIAAEKAGIIKEGSVCVLAPQEDEVVDIVKKICDERSAKLILIGRDIRYKEIRSDISGMVFDVDGLFDQYKGLRLRLLGSHQVINAVTAIGIAESLRFDGININGEAIRKGISCANWPGRLEIVRKRSPRIILDGAHNGGSARELSRTIRRLFKYGKIILILALSKDKDVKAILKELMPLSDEVILTKSNVKERAMDTKVIKDMITDKAKRVYVNEAPESAISQAISIASPNDIILITGSLFLVGQARAILTGE